jgi:hypothetical protein
MELARERAREADPRIGIQQAAQLTAVTDPHSALEKLRSGRNRKRKRRGGR